MTNAIVVGSGPNGLAAAITLATAGVNVTVIEATDRIGGGTRTSELTLPGVLHDDCSAFHPTGVASPFLTSLNLERYGLEWRWPEVQLAHPLDDGTAGVLHRSIDETAAGLGTDGARWRQTFTPLVDGFDELVSELFRPIVHVPRHPVLLARFGLPALLPATLCARRWKTDQARALFGGVAAHVIHPLTRPLTASVGLMLIAAGHAYGWPVARGGSAAITDAMAALLAELGGEIRTGERVRTSSELADAEIVVFDLAPGAVAMILGDQLPNRIARAYQRYRHGPGAFKLDLAVEGGVPWTHPACRAAGMVHVGGTLEELVVAARDVNRGVMPDRPFVLVGQQSLADPSRARDGVHPIWTYAHVPSGFTGDASEAIIGQIERFAPGVRDRIVGRFTRSALEMEAYNVNYVGGDISTGANTSLQVVMRPRVALHPYSTGVPGRYLGSAATPPGAGVHGMCGHNAARAALRALE